jgi:hypothetical protein
MVVQDHGVELAPDQFRQPHGRAFAASAALLQIDDRAHQVAHRQRAEAEVHRQVGWPFTAGKSRATL